MYTAAGIASQIVTAIVTEFSQTNRIDPAHLLEDTDALTPVEVVSATVALGMWKTEPPHETVYDEQGELDPEPMVGNFTGRRYSFRAGQYYYLHFAPRPGYEQRRTRYGVAS
jgi:hypothetical protein